VIDVRPDGFVVIGRERAKPLAPDERRSLIIDAAIPLIREHGRAVSTRQLADAAGVAEGTLFRAFGDKDSIIQSAIDRFMDPEPLRNALRAIDPDEPTDDKVRQVLHLLRERFAGFIGFMSAIGMQGPPPGRPAGDGQWLELIGRVFREDEVAVPIPTLAFYLRLLAFGTSIPVFNSPHEFSTDELAGLIMRGVLPTASATTAATTTQSKGA
jgi:AcrR family transcriptional regulator